MQWTHTFHYQTALNFLIHHNYLNLSSHELKLSHMSILCGLIVRLYLNASASPDCLHCYQYACHEHVIVWNLSCGISCGLRVCHQQNYSQGIQSKNELIQKGHLEKGSGWEGFRRRGVFLAHTMSSEDIMALVEVSG